MYELIIGKINQKRNAQWDLKDEDPFDILETELYRAITNLNGVVYCSEYLRDKVKIDWGSWAWKANKQELIQLNSNFELVHFSPDVFSDGEEYGVVFVEGIATEDFFDDED